MYCSTWTVATTQKNDKITDVTRKLQASPGDKNSFDLEPD